MTTVFISYAHADEELRRQLDVHLASLRRQRIIDVWHDRKIVAGQDFGREIDAALARADIVLLLVSADFINSEYCYSVEMAEALKRNEAGASVVIPVILRACDWHDLPFGKLQATPTEGKPVRLFSDIDSALLEVVRDIKAAALMFRNGGAVTRTPTRSTASESPVVMDRPRSGNLRIKSEFTDFDRDQFRAATFEYLARYFDGSLSELEARNAGIRSVFRRVDATAFEATIYDAAGGQRSHCGIWLGSRKHFGGDIGYSSSGLGERNSYNESLSVDDDGTSLGLRALGLLTQGNGRKLLTQEGAAEHLWSAFILPLQG